MLRIRLTRMGAKKQPFYRVIIKEKRSKRDGKYMENLGTYNPMVDPPEVKLNHERIEYWISKGAKPSETVASLIKNNPQLTEEEQAAADKKRADMIAARREAEAKAKAEKAQADREAAEKKEAEKAAADKAEAEKAAAESKEAEAAETKTSEAEEASVEVKADTAPDTKAEAATDDAPEAKAETKADDASEAKAETETDDAPEVKADVEKDEKVPSSADAARVKNEAAAEKSADASKAGSEKRRPRQKLKRLRLLMENLNRKMRRRENREPEPIRILIYPLI